MRIRQDSSYLRFRQAIALNAKAERTRHKVLILRQQLNTRFAWAKIEWQNCDKQEHLAKVECEIQFKSKVHVEHKSTLKQKVDRGGAAL
jgi:hypothetical protein